MAEWWVDSFGHSPISLPLQDDQVISGRLLRLLQGIENRLIQEGKTPNKSPLFVGPAAERLVQDAVKTWRSGGEPGYAERVPVQWLRRLEAKGVIK